MNWRTKFPAGPNYFQLLHKHAGGMRKLAAVIRDEGEDAARAVIQEAHKKAVVEADEA